MDVKALTSAAAFGRFGVDAELTAPGVLPVAVRVIGPDRRLFEVPSGAGFVMGAGQTLIAVQRSEAVPGVPRNTTIEVAGRIWTVENIATDDGDIVTAIVR